MTTEQQQEYVQNLFKTDGRALHGFEQELFGKAKQAADAAMKAAHALQTALEQVERIKTSRSTIDGQYQAYVDMLVNLEQARRTRVE